MKLVKADVGKISAELRSFSSHVDDEFGVVKQLIKDGFNKLESSKVRGEPNNNVGKPIPVIGQTKPRISILGEDNSNSSPSPGGNWNKAERKRSRSRARVKGQNPAPYHGRGNRNDSVGPPKKLQGVTPCPVCDFASCDSPTRCLMELEWSDRIALHTQKRLCPSYTCLKSHRDKCWKYHTVYCSFCEGRHHLAWCRAMATCKNVVSPGTNSAAGKEK